MTPLDRNDETNASDIVELTALVRRVVAARVRDPDVVDDMVQETLARMLTARVRLDRSALGPYAIVTARNIVASHWRRLDTGKRHEHRLIDPNAAAGPDDALLRGEEAEAIKNALDRLTTSERHLLVAHEVEGRDTSSLADAIGSTPGAVAAQLNRSRAKLRVEYLLELNGTPPNGSCRPVLLSLSVGDRRRQAELDAGYHLLDCDFCAALSEPLFDRRMKGADNEARVVVEADADIVRARQSGHAIAMRAGFNSTEATVVATAISEVARNIVRFARRGEVYVSIVTDGEANGVTVVARDVGPGIEDIDLALKEGYTTYGGRGLGLPGARKLMDEFEISSEVGYGTTVTMTKWHRR
jgi:serine/threonine-protein kinase RsbT